MAQITKGDLAVVHRRHSATYLDTKAGIQDRDAFEVGRVRKTDRSGLVQEVDLVGGGIIRRGAHDVVDILAESRKAVDVDAVLDAAKKHHYPGHPGQPMAFDSLADVLAIARPHKIHRVLR